MEQTDPKQDIVQRLKAANNVLVTVSANPSVDQLSAAIGFTLLLNKMGKHATAVFSGAIPSTIEFLQPEETLEKNTDSLRDFIISLDKSKADKLRYKVEDSVVRIYITPYRTSLTSDDLEFSQGDFNVDAVVALGVKKRDDLDQAIVAHGRILHDATVISVNNHGVSEIGAINLNDESASSLCEMLVGISEQLQADALDQQISTAFLTGIVAETDRFSNQKTSSLTMSLSAKLMAAGANQQLVASKLVTQTPTSSSDASSMTGQPAVTNEDGALDIDHKSTDDAKDEEIQNILDSSATNPAPEADVDDIHIDEHGTLHATAPESQDEESAKSQRLVLEPPTLGGKLTANSEPEALDPSTDPLTTKQNDQPLLTHDDSSSEDAQNDQPEELPEPHHDPTLTDLEKTVHSRHVAGVDDRDDTAPKQAKTDEDSADPTPEPIQQPEQSDAPEAGLDEARQAVEAAMAASSGEQTAVEHLEADNSAPTEQSLPTTGAVFSEPGQPAPIVPEFTMPENLVPPAQPTDATASPTSDPTAPPPVPPPMMPPAFGMPDQNQPPAQQ
jgi:nanoRNase/pAp phosphatase (c-di-AMP/oligoRNAs hydrolase)